jgi:hypothetical protein
MSTQSYSLQQFPTNDKECRPFWKVINHAIVRVRAMAEQWLSKATGNWIGGTAITRQMVSPSP